MTQRSIVITGANSGIGKAMAHQLAAAGHQIALVCRNAEKGRAACDEIAEVGEVELFVADLGSVDAVNDVAGALEQRFGAIDVLINNAGVHLHTRSVNELGLEMMFMVNHVAPYLLTGRLLGALRKSADPRVVTLSSMGHKMARIRWDDLQCERRFMPTIQYGNTKLYNIWFTSELQRRCDWLTATCFHPGAVATGFAQDDAGFLNVLMKVGKPFLRSAEKAARTGVFLATEADASEVAGRYLVDSRVRAPSRLARDETGAARLWEETERLTSYRYPSVN